ncbi:vitelline membrane outer layer protein 1-like [Malaclemys terrapin pileata]|uniref:vitelline membrane outer layer protein 1-like n=1 Tax=Malaclemys terrapin pileata TaxID=2991368 RepID=UPI0023A7FC65|nr:vitelline membrane outer layer protein 1-like [Malaclemys terrapin pileata]
MQLGALLCLLLAPGAMLGGQAKVPPSRPYNQVIVVPNGAPWGTWGPVEMCPEGSYANGFALKVHPYQGDAPGEDDTGLNGIRLHCSNGATVQSSVGAWGRWQGARYCPQGYLRAVSLGVHPQQDAGDDVAATGLRVACSDRELLAGDAGDTGDQEGSWSHPCLSGSVCGLQTRVEEPGSKRGDNTALNDARFFCCPP